MTALILFGLFFILLFLNVPIAYALAVSSISALLSLDSPLLVLPNNIYSATTKFVLLAIPFFILGGNVMERSGISSRLIDFFRTLVGHKRTGMALVTVLVACFFAAISGSGPATVAAIGLILIPAMTNVGYDRNYSTALVSTAGAIGIVIPPSITFVIYGAIASASVGALFASGIIPGLLMGLFLMLTTSFLYRNKELEILPKATWGDRWKAFKNAFWGLMMPVIILGGIYGGLFTPTEAAAVSSVYGIIVGLFYKAIKLKDIWELLITTVSQTAVVMIIVGSASLFAYVLTVTGIASEASSALVSLCDGNKYVFLIIINIILLITGCFIDANSAMFILVPILLPVAKLLEINPVHLGCIMVLNLAIGLVTPPVGVNLYVGCGIGGIKLKQICSAVWPLIIASILSLLLVTYWEPLAMFLPGLLAK